MSNVIMDMGNMYPEHRTIMDNFIGLTFPMVKGTSCKVMREAKYHWDEDTEEFREPDISILCSDRKRQKLVYTAIPRFIVEVLSKSTEQLDRVEKMNLYCKIGVEEYWILDWRKRKIERYLLSDDASEYLLYDVIDDTNKELNILSFPNIKIDFDDLMDVSE